MRRAESRPRGEWADRLRVALRGSFGLHAQAAVALGASLGAVWPLALSVVAPHSGVAGVGPILVSTALGVAAGAGFAALAHTTIGARATRVARQMRAVSEQVRRAADAGQVGRVTPGRCRIEGALDDSIGDCARAYTDLVAALTRSTEVESAARDFSETLCEGLELGGLSRKALARLMDATGATAGAVLVARGGDFAVTADQGFDRANELTNWPPLRKAVAPRPSNDVRHRKSGDARSHDHDDEEDESGVGEPAQASGAGAPAQTSSADGPVGLTVSTEQDVLFRSLLDDAIGVTGARVVPLVLRGVSVGVLVLATSGELTAEAEAVLRLFTPVLAVAVRSATAQEDLEKSTGFDLMTGLITRDIGLKKLREALVNGLRAGTSVGVLVVDIDQLGAVNEAFGRVYGDRALVHVAHAIRRMLRPADALVRWDDDELLVVLDGATRDDTRSFGERVISTIRSMVILEGQEPLRVTVSAGGDAYPVDPVEYEDDLVEHARRALANAKTRGPGSIGMYRLNEVMDTPMIDEFGDDDGGSGKPGGDDRLTPPDGNLRAHRVA